MRVLVTGAKGQLGYDVVKELDKRGITAVGADRDDMDITDVEQVNAYLAQAQIDAVIHCAAYTAVDAAEDDIAKCREINVHGTRNIAESCRLHDVPMMYISTDYVFDGSGVEPWEPDSERSPVNVYGQTKYEGEVEVEKLLTKYFIVRISWVFGKNGKNFVQTMLRLGASNEKLSVVNDQFGSPTYTVDLAVTLADMIVTDKYGVYHATNEGFCTWYEFADEIFRQSNLDVQIIPVDSSAFPTKAARPLNSRMSKEKLRESGFSKLPSWKDALSRYLDEINCEPNKQ